MYVLYLYILDLIIYMYTLFGIYTIDIKLSILYNIQWQRIKSSDGLT